MDEDGIVGYVIVWLIGVMVLLFFGVGDGLGLVLRDVFGMVEVVEDIIYVEVIFFGDCGVVLRVVGRRKR